jgi:hypothetical protein
METAFPGRLAATAQSALRKVHHEPQQIACTEQEAKMNGKPFTPA